MRISVNLCFLSAVIVAALPAPIFAQPGQTTAQGQASVDIVAPISVAPIDDLDFGGIAVAASASGSVIVDPISGNASYFGTAYGMCSGSAGCTPHSALFLVKGEAERGYSVAIPSSARARPQNGSGPDLLVTNLNAITHNLSNRSLAGVLDMNGQDKIRVGGTLEIPAATPPGRYSAEINLTVTYN